MQDDAPLTPMPPAPAVEELSGTSGPPVGFWRRFVSSLVDGIVLGIISTILRLVLGAAAGTGLGFVVAAVYFTYFHGAKGQSPGNAALGIRVVDIDSGEVIGYSRAFIRWIISYVSGIVILLGYLWMLWDPRKQTWHDKAAGSLPVKVGY